MKKLCVTVHASQQFLVRDARAYASFDLSEVRRPLFRFRVSLASIRRTIWPKVCHVRESEDLRRASCKRVFVLFGCRYCHYLVWTSGIALPSYFRSPVKVLPAVGSQ